MWSDNIMTEDCRTEDCKLPSAWFYLGREFILLQQHSKLFKQVTGKGTPFDHCEERIKFSGMIR